MGNGGSSGESRWGGGDDPGEARDLLDQKQTLALLGISEQTLRRRRHAGLITPVPHNPAKQWAQNYYRRADVERLAQGSGIIAPDDTDGIDNTDDTDSQTDHVEGSLIV